ncbi:MAG: polysaccharide biosynthesis tyrosine autokinase [Pirellulaceae bacterium]
MRDEHHEVANMPNRHSSQGTLELPMKASHLASQRLGGLSRSPKPSEKSGSSALSVSFVLGVARQWWKIATPLGLLLAGLGAAWTAGSFKPTYEASAWLRIEDRRPYIAFPTRDESRRFVSTQVELMRSPLVIGPAVSKPEVARTPELAAKADPIGWLGQHVNVRAVGNSELFVVSFASINPEAASTVVNEVVDSYLQLRGFRETERTQLMIDLLTKELDRRSVEVGNLRDEVKKLSVSTTGKDPFADGLDTQLVRDPLTELQMQLNSAEVERTVAEVQAEVLTKSIEANQLEVPEEAIERAVDEHPSVEEIHTAIKENTILLGEYEARLVGGKTNRLHVQLAEKLKKDEERLSQLRERLRQEMRIELQSGFLKQRSEEIAAIKKKVEDYTTLEKALKERCDEESKNRSTLSGVTVDLEFRRGELARAQAVHDEIADRIVTLRTEIQAPERVEKMQEATVPAVPKEVLPWKRLYMLCMGLFGLPFGLAVGWELYVRRVGDADRLEQDTQLSVVGEISRLPTRSSGLYGFGARRVERELTMFEESIDSLRTSLLLSESLKDMKVILVTSAASGEGKTSVAVQLAVSLARASGKRTLLVDGDMRSPDIHRLLGLSLEPGLCDVLSGDVSFEEAVQTEYNNQVHVLTAGRIKTSPHRLVGNGTLRPMFDAFRAAYDYIVVDSPPILAVSESLVLAKQADASLVCAMRDTSRVDQVRRAYNRLLAASGQPVGVVLNGVPTDHYYRRYGSYGYNTGNTPS